jgi:hypothetical protein
MKLISLRWGEKPAMFLKFVLGFSLFSLGCGPYSGSVSGKVNYKGKPLPGGLVTIVHPDGRTKQTKIQPDGTYSIPDAPGGDVKIAVKTVPPIPSLPGNPFDKGQKVEAAKPAGDYVPIPGKYANQESSGLATKISRGSNTFDIELQP